MRSGIRVAVVIGLALAIIVCAIGVAVASPEHVLVNRDQSRSSELEPQSAVGDIRAALLKPGRPGVRKIAAQFKVDPSTVQRISMALR
jgi:hypothetical protein